MTSTASYSYLILLVICSKTCIPTVFKRPYRLSLQQNQRDNIPFLPPLLFFSLLNLLLYFLPLSLPRIHYIHFSTMVTTCISSVLLSITFVSLSFIPHSTQSLLHMQTCLASQAMTVPSSARLTMRGGTSRSQSTLDPPRHTQLVILALWPRSVVTCGRLRRTRQKRRGEWEDKKREWEWQKHKFLL